MKPYPVEFREKIVKAYEKRDTSIRKLASRFDVSKSFVDRTYAERDNSLILKGWRRKRNEKACNSTRLLPVSAGQSD